MSRLTKEIREKIVRKAIAAAFKERDEAHKLAGHKLGIECYEAVIPEAERKAASKMPERWLMMDSCLRFNANGWDVTLRVDKAVPVPYSTSCRRIGNVTGELAERVQAHSQAEKGVMEARWKAESEMSGFLEQFKSIKQMREAWPEGEQFYSEFDIDRPASGVPAVRVAEINKLLGLAA